MIYFNKGYMRSFIIIAITLVSITTNCFSNEPQQIEQELLMHAKKVKYWQEHQSKIRGKVNTFDSLVNENRIFKGILLEKTANEPSTFSYPFDSLRKYISITTSDDNKLRIYSWHTGDTESMCFYNNVFQYEANNRIHSTPLIEDDEYNPKGYYSDIKSLQRDNDVIYLGYFHAFYSPKDFVDSYETFKIENNELKDSIPIFKTKDLENKPILTSSIFVLYNPITLKKRKKNKLLIFDNKKKRIKVTKTDNFGNLLKEYLIYEFKENEFEVLEKDK